MDTKATVTPCVIICGENGLNDDVFLINAGGSSSGGDGGGVWISKFTCGRIW